VIALLFYSRDSPYKEISMDLVYLVPFDIKKYIQKTNKELGKQEMINEI
jgi:hypothetical protein